MKVSKCPSDTLTMTNRAIVNTRDFDKQVRNSVNYVKKEGGKGTETRIYFTFLLFCSELSPY